MFEIYSTQCLAHKTINPVAPKGSVSTIPESWQNTVVPALADMATVLTQFAPGKGNGYAPMLSWSRGSMQLTLMAFRPTSALGWPAPYAGNDVLGALFGALGNRNYTLPTMWRDNPIPAQEIGLFHIATFNFATPEQRAEFMHQLILRTEYFVARLGDEAYVSLYLAEGSTLFAAATGDYSKEMHDQYNARLATYLDAVSTCLLNMPERSAQIALFESFAASVKPRDLKPVTRFRRTIEKMDADYQRAGPLRRTVFGDLSAEERRRLIERLSPRQSPVLQITEQVFGGGLSLGKTPTPKETTMNSATPLPDEARPMYDLLQHIKQEHPDSPAARSIAVIADNGPEKAQATTLLTTFLVVALENVSLANLWLVCHTLMAEHAEEVPVAADAPTMNAAYQTNLLSDSQLIVPVADLPMFSGILDRARMAIAKVPTDNLTKDFDPTVFCALLDGTTKLGRQFAELMARLTYLELGSMISQGTEELLSHTANTLTSAMVRELDGYKRDVNGQQILADTINEAVYRTAIAIFGEPAGEGKSISDTVFEWFLKVVNIYEGMGIPPKKEEVKKEELLTSDEKAALQAEIAEAPEAAGPVPHSFAIATGGGLSGERIKEILGAEGWDVQLIEGGPLPIDEATRVKMVGGEPGPSLGGLKTTASEDFPPGESTFHSTRTEVTPARGVEFEVEAIPPDVQAWRLPDAPNDKGQLTVTLPTWVYEVLLSRAFEVESALRRHTGLPMPDTEALEFLILENDVDSSFVTHDELVSAYHVK